jgi:DNA modification methylase
MTTPYYQDEFVTLYHGDCLEIEEWQSADVLVTDPPYGVKYVRQDGSIKRPIANDENTDVRNAVLDIWQDRPALVFGVWKVQKPKNTRNTLIWSKAPDPGLGDCRSPWGWSYEEIYLLGRGFVGERRANVITHRKMGPHDSPDHPTPKPVGLMEKLIVTCPPGVIADPFAGSGSTLIAARNLARFAIGVEMEEQYCEIIAKRLSQDVFRFEF